jgi:hypothetical protein
MPIVISDRDNVEAGKLWCPSFNVDNGKRYTTRPGAPILEYSSVRLFSNKSLLSSKQLALGRNGFYGLRWAPIAYW